MVCLMLISMLAACGEEKAPKKPETVKLWYGYNTENFMQDYEYTEVMASRDSSLRMYGIRGDVESVQLIITPKNDVETFTVEVDDLLNADGKKIGKSKIEVFCQWYINVEGSYNTAAGKTQQCFMGAVNDDICSEGFGSVLRMRHI